MTDSWKLESIYKVHNRNSIYQTQTEQETIPELFKFDGYYLGNLIYWKDGTGKIEYYRYDPENLIFTFCLDNTRYFKDKELERIVDSEVPLPGQSAKNKVLFKPGIYAKGEPYCSEVLPVRIKAHEISKVIYAQTSEYFLNSLFYIPDLKLEYGKYVLEHAKVYVANFNCCGFANSHLSIKFDNRIISHVGKDNDSEYSSFSLFVRSDIYNLSLIYDIVMELADELETDLGNIVKTQKDKDFGLKLGILSITQNLEYTDELIELKRRNHKALLDTYLIRHQYLKKYDTNTHLNYLEKYVNENSGLDVWDINKIIHKKFES